MSRGARIRVGLLFGGRSGEHAISIRSARSIVAAIDRTRFDLTLIGIDRGGRWYLHSERRFDLLQHEVSANGATEVIPAPRTLGGALTDPQKPQTSILALDVVFPVLHGPFGEDGTVQGLLEMADVPYVGAGVLGSAIGMDKDVQKRLLREAGLPVVAFEVVTRREWERDPNAALERAGGLGAPVFTKPANLGSSLGISKVRDPKDLPGAIEHALAYDNKVLVERGIDAREIECSVLGNDAPRASVPGEIVSGEEFYSYAAKYDDDSKSQLLIPAPLPPDLTAAVQSLAVRAFQVLECAGMARVDFFLERGSGRLYLNELNTIPGFTSISMYPKLWEASGLSYSHLITRLIELALERHAGRERLRG